MFYGVTWIFYQTNNFSIQRSHEKILYWIQQWYFIHCFSLSALLASLETGSMTQNRVQWLSHWNHRTQSQQSLIITIQFPQITHFHYLQPTLLWTVLSQTSLQDKILSLPSVQSTPSATRPELPPIAVCVPTQRRGICWLWNFTRA